MVNVMNNKYSKQEQVWLQISAAVDGEAEADGAWLADPETRYRWQSYHIIRDSLRQSQQLGGGMSADSLAQLSQRLRQTSQDAVSAPPVMEQTAANQPFFKWFALAASTAAVAVAAWQVWPAHEAAPSVSAMEQPALPVVQQSPTAVQPAGVVPAAATKLEPVLDDGAQIVPVVDKQDGNASMPQLQ